MSNVNDDGIVTPDETNSLDPEIWSAAMADSISNGIGVRLAKQEAAVGLKAGIAPGTTVAFASGIIAPFEVLDGEECFTQGLELSGGIASIATEGMYHASAQASLEPWSTFPENENRTIALQIFKNGLQMVGCEVGADENHWATAVATTVVRCIEGDTLHARWYSAGPVPGEGTGTLSSNSAMNSMSIVLVTPVN